MSSRDLSKYNHSIYHPGKNAIVRGLWYFTNAFIFNNAWWPYYGLKRALLRCFGAKIGRGVVIKPSVNIKYPWHLSIGDYSWIGENVWIDNLDDITIGANCCISQGALLLCGNHDYTKETFDLKTASIQIKDGAWIGAKAIVCPGVTIEEDAVLTVNSVASKNISAHSIWQGNPAVEKRKI